MHSTPTETMDQHLEMVTIYTSLIRLHLQKHPIQSHQLYIKQPQDAQRALVVRFLLVVITFSQTTLKCFITIKVSLSFVIVFGK